MANQAPKKDLPGWRSIDPQKPGIYVPERRLSERQGISRDNVDRLHQEFRAFLRQDPEKGK